MAKNITGAQAGTVQSNNVNNPNVDYMRGRNQFPQSFMHPSTCRYGEVDPVLTFKCERGDVVPYKFVTDLNTFTMAAPLKSEVDMYTAAFKVPMEALYPRNWDIMQPIPNRGDDVPDDTRALFSPQSFGYSLNTGILTALEIDELDKVVRNVFLLELIYSAGSIFAKCNYHFNSTRFNVVIDDEVVDFSNFDYYFDNHFTSWLIDLLLEDVFLYHYDSETPDYKVTLDLRLIGSKYSSNGYYISLRRAFELLRTGEYLLNISDSVVPNFKATFPRWAVTGQGSYLNIEPIISYKCACSHFFTNPKIDYVYSWELFRDAQQSLVYGEDGSVPTFNWNGINKQYDVFSKMVLDHAAYTVAYPSNGSLYFEHTSFWYNLFSYSRSLRYGDYFTGVHPEPLAVGDVNAPVVDSSVDAIEMVSKIQMARLLNKANIAGPRKDDQLVAMYGGPLPEAPKDVPIRLSLEKFSVTGFETNNTGDLQAQAITGSSQNITTTNLRLTDSKYMFEVAIDEPCWIVVVQYFEAHRIYSNTLDRFAFHRDRLDDFQPDLQYLGDQEVYTQELDCVNGTEVAFAYNLRNMEYKQRYSYASGGFIDYLPSWLFITDNNDGNPPMPYITPEYIRSSPSEFDRFYKSLLGWSLASYFHFITTNTNVIAPYRQMVYAPEILA